MVELAPFLTNLGLSQYIGTFADSDIDGSALLDLEETHLKELGLSLGHRVRLMKAITELRLAESRAPAPVVSNSVVGAAPDEVRRATSQSSADGERRQLTLMFADLVGSTELAARADPEDVRDVMRAYQDACADSIARYDGYLAKYLGDGVLAYFGYPHAHEDAAERAVRAARDIVEAIDRLTPVSGHRLSVRVGIATGMVVVGAVAAPDGASELSAIGDTPNLAARLQALAEPNSVVIADSTRALTRGAFRYVDLGNRKLKGISEPVRVWQVAGNVAASRFEAAYVAGLSRFVGREPEVALLNSRWEQTLGGEGQAVLLCGEAGVGKSRIAEQLRQRLEGFDHTRIRYQCSPFHVNSALQPVISQLEHAADLTSEDEGSVRLAKLEALIAPTTTKMEELVPLLASLLRIPLGSRYFMPNVTSDVLKRRTLEALAGQLVALAQTKPVFWLVEDAHWIDPTTRELVGLCLDRFRDLPVFALITFRPEFVHSWGHLPHVTGLALNRLARRQCSELIDSLCAGKSLPAEVLGQIIAKTDGIPLFIEELTKTVLESGLLIENDGRYALKGTLAPMAIPATLQDSLIERLERLSPVKEVAQIGSAIGREFSYDLLAGVTELRENELKEALGQLANAELVYVRGEPPDATYVFKHALVQDAAYASLLRARRQQIHSRIAQVLPKKFPDLIARQPETLAHHCEAAGLEAAAKEYWSRAGRLALMNATYAEATNHFAKALALVAKEAASEAKIREESGLLLDRGIAMLALKGPPSAEHARIAADALTASAPLGDDALHFRARWADWIVHSVGGKLPEAAERADALVGIANRIGADDLRLQAHHARWTTAFARGHVTIAKDAVENGLALYDLGRHREHWSMYGAHDPGVCACSIGAITFWQAGFAARAQTLYKQGIGLGAELGHPFSVAAAHMHGTFFAMMVNDSAAADVSVRTVTAVATEANLAWPGRLGRFLKGWVMARQGEIGRGADQMEASFRDLQERKERLYLTLLGTLLVSAKLEIGRYEETLAFLDELQVLSVETHQRLFVPEHHRLRAETMHRLNPKSPGIEAEYGKALKLAQEQGALALELRAACGLAARLAERGSPAEGTRVLRPVFERFTEGHATPDLQAAKVLLDGLDQAS
jgi:class 3 adenylate cyclase/tetratricopeptide (TPR) repeat protein